jgi:predicted amidophosphoribosyltransferase
MSLEKIIQFFLPSFCQSCEKKLDNHKIFCGDCQQGIKLRDPNQFCQRCGSCKAHDCQQLESNWTFAACLEQTEPGTWLINQSRKGEYANLISDIYLRVFLATNWPQPDVIIPLPGRNDKRIFQLLARKLNCPYKESLSKAFWALPKQELPPEHRARVIINEIKYKGPSIKDKNILLVDDFVVSFASLKQAVHVLEREEIKGVYALVGSKMSKEMGF